MSATAAPLGTHALRAGSVGPSPARSRIRSAAVALAVATVATATSWLSLPLVARMAADLAPQAVRAHIGRATIAALDATTFSPSRLTPARQKELRREFLNLKHPKGTFVMWRIEFRGGNHVAPNAFALPNSTIVVTDALVEAARDDREIMAILAHEMGHLDGRHTLRTVLERTPLDMVSMLAGNHIDGLVGGATEAVLGLRYSSAMERDADDFACRMIRANGISPAFPGNLVSRLERREATPGAEGPVPDFFATHGSAAELAHRLSACEGAVAAMRT